LEVDGSDESLLSEELSTENAWPWSKTADGGRARVGPDLSPLLLGPLIALVRAVG